MQKKVKITVAPLWVGVVSFFQADGISRMQNKMENEMTATVKEIETKQNVSIMAGRGGKVHTGWKLAGGQLIMTCGCACSFTTHLRLTDLEPTCKNSLKRTNV
jgi:hypothetical protein